MKIHITNISFDARFNCIYRAVFTVIFLELISITGKRFIHFSCSFYNSYFHPFKHCCSSADHKENT